MTRNGRAFTYVYVRIFCIYLVPKQVHWTGGGASVLRDLRYYVTRAHWKFSRVYVYVCPVTRKLDWHIIFLCSRLNNLKIEKQKLQNYKDKKIFGVFNGNYYYLFAIIIYSHIAQNIAERCQEYFLYFIAIEIFVKYYKIFHRNITI